MTCGCLVPANLANTGLAAELPSWNCSVERVLLHLLMKAIYYKFYIKPILLFSSNLDIILSLTNIAPLCTNLPLRKDYDS